MTRRCIIFCIHFSVFLLFLFPWLFSSFTQNLRVRFPLCVSHFTPWRHWITYAQNNISLMMRQSGMNDQQDLRSVPPFNIVITYLYSCNGISLWTVWSHLIWTTANQWHWFIHCWWRYFLCWLSFYHCGMHTLWIKL